MKKPLVSPVKNDVDTKLQELILFYEETLGFCPNSVKTMYHRPEIAYAFIALNKAVMENKGRVTSDLKRLIGFVSSNVAGCQYCQAHTIRAAERYDAHQEKLENIWDFESHPIFSDAERVVLEFALKSSLIPNEVDDALAEKMRQHWDDGEIVEILGVVSLFGFLNRWNDSMGTQMETEAIESGEKFLTKKGWSVGKHNY
jgi:uncharacterized peroxidase-related enzyme